MSFDKEQYSTENIICPYCEHEREPEGCDGDYNEDGFDEECEECEKTFWVSPHVSWAWATKQDCELNKQEHDWKKEWKENKNIGLESKDGKSIYSICSKCEQTNYIDKELVK